MFIQIILPQALPGNSPVLFLVRQIALHITNTPIVISKAEHPKLQTLKHHSIIY